MKLQCNDNQADRALGGYWEQMFCLMAAQHGRMLTRHQFHAKCAAAAFYLNAHGRQCRIILPDVTLWSAPGEHHEIKHKEPTPRGFFGLEGYRIDSLLWFARASGQPVYYTIHNHYLNGGREDRSNHIEHWITQDVLSLSEEPRDEMHFYKLNDVTYINGIRSLAKIGYWHQSLFVPLGRLWTPSPPEPEPEPEPEAARIKEAWINEVKARWRPFWTPEMEAIYGWPGKPEKPGPPVND
jgi:hypothetical protein